jgi:hypothetical protein
MQVKAPIASDPQGHHENAIAFAEALCEGVRIAVIANLDFGSIDRGRAIAISHQESHPVAAISELSSHKTSHAAGRSCDDDHEVEG